MRRNVLTYGVMAMGVTGLIYAAAQAGQNPTPASPGQDTGHHMMPGIAAKSDGMHSGGMMSGGMSGAWMGSTGMMGEMMGPLAALDRPLVRSLFGAFVLPELQAELGLTADEASQLRQQKADLLTKGEDFSRKIAAKERELDAMFSPDTSKGQQVKLLLEQIAELRAQQHYAIYTAARKMKAVLTEDQRNRLEAMKPEELRHAAMSHLTLEDFAKAMALLRFAA